MPLHSNYLLLRKLLFKYSISMRTFRHLNRVKYRSCSILLFIHHASCLRINWMNINVNFLCIPGCFGTTSVPVAIPPVSGGGMQRGSAGSLSQSPPSPFGSFTPSFGPLHIPVHHHPKQEQQFEQVLHFIA